MVTAIGIASGIGIAFVASRLPGWWFLFPVKLVMWLGGLILIGNALFKFFAEQGAITLVE